MVMLTIVTQKNGETIFLDQAIPQVDFMKLRSCSLYNSWYTLKKQSIAIMGEETKPIDTSTIPPGQLSKTNRQHVSQFVCHTFKNKNKHGQSLASN